MTLPTAGSFNRWTRARKAQIVVAVNGQPDKKEAFCQEYGLSIAEVDRWLELAALGGADALKTTKVQTYRVRS